ncbi:U-box domain-containing protein 44-like [Tasmannia lanceolata]|uniref:U-box domain-containing protein 44-like n=1 Tax=Tasmannia lanceolata TaxID=3420 RepID=UPI00406292E6
MNPMDITITAVQELCNNVMGMVLEAEVQDHMFEKESFRKFSEYIAKIKSLVQVLHDKRVGSTTSSASMRMTLQTLASQLRNTCKIIENYRSGSRIRLFVNSRSMLSQMQQSAKDIAETISLLGSANFSVTLDLKAKTDQIASNLRSMEFRSVAGTEAIILDIERSISQNDRNRDHAIKLLRNIAKAIGVSPEVSLLRKELEVLKKENEEMEAQKQQAEALQLSQLIQFLSSSEIVLSKRNERIATNRHDPISSFTCPLCNEVMEDPVAIGCGHSFERRAIAEHFERGATTCPLCKEELSSLCLTPNISLRNSIQEWQERNMNMKLQSALSAITDDDPNMVNQGLHDLQFLMETPNYRGEVTKQGLIPKIAELLKANTDVNTKAALKCLSYLANYSDDNKEAIAGAGAIDHIVKQFYRGETEPDAVAVLLELSEKETLAEKIGNAKYCIPVLVSLLQNPNPNISEKATKVVQNLSSNIHFVVKMAEAGHFQPLIIRFKQGPLETQASMATNLVTMQLNEKSVQVFKDRQFVSALVQVLSSCSPAWRSACLQCIKKLSAYPEMGKRFLEEPTTIPALLRIISFLSSDPHWKLTATDILTSLVGASQLADFQTNSNFKELQSPDNIDLFLHLAINSPQMKAQFLRLLLAICDKSEKARNLVQCDDDAMRHLFSSLNGDQPDESLQALKLIYCVAKENPAGIPLPPSPAKEDAITALVTILTSSQEMEERSIAAGIISHLPLDDTTVDMILHRTEALKAIGEVIRATDEWTVGVMASATPSESLLENALAALLRYSQPTKPELQSQLGQLELYPSLVRVLSNGSSLAKQRTAIAMAHLSQSTSSSTSDNASMGTGPHNSMPIPQLIRLFSNISWCFPSAAAQHESHCSLHGSACSSRYTFCLVKADAVKPLVQTLSEKDSGVAEAALQALDTMFKDNDTLSHAATEIVQNKGVPAILDVLEKGSLTAKNKALDIFQKIFENSEISIPHLKRCKTILIHLLQEETLKKKAALVLSMMDVIDKQSSYF